MTVLNRQMFQPMQTQPNTPVTPLSSLVRRQLGTPPGGETAVSQFNPRVGIAQTNQGSNALIEKTNEIIRILNERVGNQSLDPNKAAEIVDIITIERRKPNPNMELLDKFYEDIVVGAQGFEQGYETWQNEQQQLRDDTMHAEEFMNTPMAVERQMGSPQMGEQANANNVGIMEGFEQGASDEAMIQEGMNARDAIDKTDTYDELMRSIRGDDLTEDDRRQELAAIVGEKDAYETPDSVLALVQPVIQMLDMEESQQGIGTTDEAMAMNMPVQEEEVVGIEETMAANGGLIKRYKYGGPVQHFKWGDEVRAGYEDILPLYQDIIGDSYDKNQTIADILLQGVAPAAFGYAAGMTGPEALSAGVTTSGKIMSADLRAKKKQETAMKLGALQSATAQQTALTKSKAGAKESYTMTGTKAEPTANDVKIAGELGFTDMDTFYNAYPSGIGTTFEWKGGALEQVSAAPAIEESYTEIGIVTGNADNDKDLTDKTGLNLSIIPPNTIIGKNEKDEYVFTDPGTKETYTQIGVVGQSDEGDANITKVTGLDTELLPPNTIIGENEKGEPVITAPKQRKKIEYVITYPSYAEDGTTIITQTSRVDISTDEGIAEYNKLLAKMAQASKALKEYWNFEKIGGVKFESITNIDVLPSQNAKGGLIRHRFAGSDRTGENGEEIQVAESTIDFENIPTELDQDVIEDIVPGIRADSSNEQILLQKANIAERAITGIDELYEMALKNPEYFGILGYGASIGKSGYLSLDQILKSLTGTELPQIDFLESPIIDNIITAVDELAYKIAQVKKEGTFRSITNKEKDAQKDLMNIYGGNATRTMDSLKQIRKFLVRDVNEFYKMTGNEEKVFELPDFYNINPRDIKQEDVTLEIIKSKLPPDMIEKIDTDPQILNAIKAIMAGADPEEVIKRYNEHKNKAQ